MGADQQFSLRWNNYISHITNAFESLRCDEDLVDVTLSCEGQKVRAHKMLLSACSTYFKDLFKENPCQHPIIILQNVKFSDLSALINFMYQGEVNVQQEHLPSFLQTAELLAIQGLTEDNDKEQDLDDQTDTIEVPDSPEMIPAKQEHPVSKPTQRRSSTVQNPMANMGSPKSIYSDSMPPTKRRRGMGSKGGGDRDSERNMERRQSVPLSHAPPPPKSVSPDPVEIIPLAPVKSEVSDYIDQSQEDESSYADSHGGDTLSQIEHIMMPSNTKTEILYGENESSMLSSGDSLSAADLNQMLSKPGPSGDSQGQEALQEFPWMVESIISLSKKYGRRRMFPCPLCDKTFKTSCSLSKHKDVHRGVTRCDICNTVFSRAAYLKQHLAVIHGIM